MNHKKNLNDLVSLLVRKKVPIETIETIESVAGGEIVIKLEDDAEIRWWKDAPKKTVIFQGKNASRYEQRIGWYFKEDTSDVKKYIDRNLERILAFAGLVVGISSIMISIIIR